MGGKAFDKPIAEVAGCAGIGASLLVLIDGMTQIGI